MASTRRTARALLAGACVVPLLAVPGVASAAPPDHAAAHGRQADSPDRGAASSRADRARQARTDQGGPPATAGRPDHAGRPAQAGRPDHAGPPAHAGGGPGGPARGRAATDDGAARTTASASTASARDRSGPSADDRTAASARGADDRSGRGRDRTTPPGRTPDGPRGRQAAGGASTPDATRPPAAGPAPEAAAPEPGPPAPPPEPAPIVTAPPSFAAVVPTTPDASPPVTEPTAPAATAAATPTTPEASGPLWARSLDQRIQGMLDDVTGTVRRTVPNVAEVLPRPLSDVVPLLLLVLGAFLVVQRGIGRGLGHVPMAGGSRSGQTPRS